jgi:hypothetical protein
MEFFVSIMIKKYVRPGFRPESILSLSKGRNDVRGNSRRRKTDHERCGSFQSPHPTLWNVLNGLNN